MTHPENLTAATGLTAATDLTAPSAHAPPTGGPFAPDPFASDPFATDPFATAQLAADRLSELTGIDRHHVALVLGSGWAAAGEILGGTLAEIPLSELPGFPGFATANSPGANSSGAALATNPVPVSTPVPGHRSVVRSVQIGSTDRHALVFGTRTHLYESRNRPDGHRVRAVAHPIRTASAAGCSTVILTNGCGGLNPDWPAGTPVLISDHLNLTGQSPLEGPTFVDLTDLYSVRLRELARRVDPTLPEGVYVQFPGPHYETPAEVRMAGILGGDLVGMSTALEAIAARHCGMDVLGMSLVTNLAAGINPTPLHHDDVTAAGAAAAPVIGRLLADIVELL